MVRGSSNTMLRDEALLGIAALRGACVAAGAPAVWHVRDEADATLAAPPPHTRAAVQRLRRQGECPECLPEAQAQPAASSTSEERAKGTDPSSSAEPSRSAAASRACPSCSPPAAQQPSWLKPSSKETQSHHTCEKVSKEGEAVTVHMPAQFIRAQKY